MGDGITHGPRDADFEAASRAVVTGVVATWNRREELERCLESLARQETPDDLDFRMIVVDDGSDDGTIDLLRAWRASGAGRRAVRLGRNHGPGVARNVALALAESEFVLWIDTDAYLLTSNGVARMVREIRADAHLGMVGCALWEDEARQTPWLLGGYLTPNLHPDLPRWKRESADVDFVTSCCSVWRRAPIVTAGGFDPYYGHGAEDVDLCLRLARGGWTMAMAPGVDAVHAMSRAGRRRAFDDFPRVFDYLERTRSYMYLKLHGFGATIRAMLHWMRAPEEFLDAYKVPLTPAQLRRARWGYPVGHLLRFPWYRAVRWRRSHLNSLPAFEEIH